MKLQTNLSIISQHHPCHEGLKKLLKNIGADYPKDKPIDFATILESTGLDNALWGLRAVLPEQEKDRDRLAREFACDCAAAVLAIYEKKYPNDFRPRTAIVVARKFARGEATREELAAARDAARDAAMDAARAAAMDAAMDAARAAAMDAALAAAMDAARAAARDAAGAAAGDAARAAAKLKFVEYFCS